MDEMVTTTANARLGRMRMGAATRFALWGLRLYVLVMLALIGAKFFHLGALVS